MYPDIFGNRAFFLPFSKKPVSTHSVFKSFSPVHTHPDIFENLRFSLSTRLQKIPGQKIYILGIGFQKAPVLVSKNAVTCEQKPYPEKKKLRFQNISGYVWTVPKGLHVLIFRARGATLKVGGPTSDSKWGG